MAMSRRSLSSSTALPARRSHAERSQATQQDLIAATIQVVAEHGLENASAFAIAKAAGVTQGALQHHFGTKKALVLRAATELVHSDDHNGNMAVWPAPDLPLRQRAEAAITAAWRLTYGRPSYVTMWSIFMACRTDAELLQHLAAEREKLRMRMADGFLKAFPELAGSRQQESFANLVFSALRGMGVQEMFQPPQSLCAGQRAVLVELLVARCEQALATRACATVSTTPSADAVAARPPRGRRRAAG
jgi:AcrR family transcriptional regulator